MIKDKYQIARLKRTVTTLKGKLGKTIKDVNLIIILFHLKLDKFYCIGAMN